MKNSISKSSVLILLTVWITFEGCKKDDGDIQPTTPSSPVVSGAISSRDSAVWDYNTNYLGSAISNPGWTGSTSLCDPGTVPQATNDAIIKRINYFRRMVGLNDNCTYDASKHAQEQDAALMMYSNYSVNHNPPSSWSCYTSQGATGASASNLALGTHSTPAVTSFMQDDGPGNEPVGHRRWILRSSTTSFSYGTTNYSMALYVFGAGGNKIIPSYIAFPPKGYIPQQLVSSRWSFGIPNADFSATTITMTGPNGSVPVTIVSNNFVGYGDNTIVWTPQGIDKTNSNDIVYSVKLSGVKNAPQSEYTYNVTVIKP